ncbi:uncharacterized protein LOC129595401 isoform X2 [Paramacrobiotus metropolitanus]|uniref:uncharacterized protein LOC129595401 isoform X2 n=1 Tax=Paramacrobiotus metropolitanus TaxID=2943436 RepID=UPI00244630F9|nr:uncharacterized protein LOC129595401 isoform X2 [Paramacrobiotus metropolitanus]
MPDNKSCDWSDAVGIDINGTGVNENVDNNSTIYVYLVLYPFLLLLCTVGSIFIIAARLKDETSRKTSTSVYMICSAFGCLCILWSTLPEYLTQVILNEYRNGTNFSDEVENVIDLALNYKGFGVFWNEAAIEFVDWTLIVFSVERLLVTTQSLSVARAMTDSSAWRRTLLIEGVLLILAVLFAVSYLPTYYYWLPYSSNSTEAMQEILPLPLGRWLTLQGTAEMGMWIAKWLLLLILDIALLCVVIRHRRNIKTTMMCSIKESSTRTSNLILMASVALYMVTQLPNVILQCMRIASRPPFCTLHLTNTHESRARPIVSILHLSNYSVSFFVLYASSSKFREQCRMLHTRVARTIRMTNSKIFTSMETLRLADSPNRSPRNSADNLKANRVVERFI